MSHQRNTASVRSTGPRIAALAVGALAFGVASVASAQTAPTDTQAAPQSAPPTTVETQPPPTTITVPTQPPTTVVVPPPESTPPPATSTTTTTSAEYNENIGAEQESSGYRPNGELMTAGAVLLGGPYIAGAIVAATNSHSYDDKLYIPVAGPWIDLGERPCTFQSRCSNADHWNAALLIGSGIAQGAGVAMILTSLIAPHHSETSAQAAAKRDKPHVAVTPVSYQGGGGVGAVGTF